MSLPVECPTCGAKPELPCRLVSGVARQISHHSRIVALRAFNEEARRSAAGRGRSWSDGMRDALGVVAAERAKVSPSIPHQRRQAITLDAIIEEFQQALKTGEVSR